MRRNFGPVAILLSLFAGMLGALGAGPGQDENVPPQPYFEDFFSGVVTVRGNPAPAGLQLIACIDDCRKVFESQPARTEDGGIYHLLEVFPPKQQRLIGHPISFYLLNEFGRIQADETSTFEAAPNRHALNLTFRDPLPIPPTPLPPPALPSVGDTTLASLPGYALGIGAAAMLGGVLLILMLRRRTA